VSLGYAHAALGERGEAVENFRRAVEVFEQSGLERERAALSADLEDLAKETRFSPTVRE
jgi:hypothetical protein